VPALPEPVWRVLRCPWCGAALERTGDGALCAGCGTAYPAPARAALDLRLRRPKRVTVDVVLGEELDTDGLDFAPLRRHPVPPVDFTGLEVPEHLTSDLLSHFPRAAPGALALDLGCGTGIHRAVCERAGFGWVGLDYGKEGAPLWGDGHALPFADAAFAFVLSVNVLEHIRYPPVMLREAHRVLAPGGRLIGTVAFNEPFHERSYYHHSHLAVVSALQHAGLSVAAVAPNRDWPVLRAQAYMGLFPKMPARLSRSIVAPVHGLHRLWWRLASLVSAQATEHARVLHTAGSFSFIATKPA
jgi:SAM-dependent methyltransferase